MSLLEETPTIPESHRRHQEAFEAFVLQQTDTWQHSVDAKRLYARFEQWNTEFYGKRLTVPYLCLLEPGTPRAYGDTSPVSGWGGKMQIRLRPSLLDGTHPLMAAGPAYAAGRFRFVADVLLHEMVHQYHMEVTRLTEGSYHGHGPAFRDVCNTIGAALGLPMVRSAKKRGADKDLPSCAQWPHNVRPMDYYLGAYVEPIPLLRVRVDLQTCQRCQQVEGYLKGALSSLKEIIGDVSTTRKSHNQARDLEELRRAHQVLQDITNLVTANRDSDMSSE